MNLYHCQCKRWRWIYHYQLLHLSCSCLSMSIIITTIIDIPCYQLIDILGSNTVHLESCWMIYGFPNYAVWQYHCLSLEHMMRFSPEFPYSPYLRHQLLPHCNKVWYFRITTMLALNSLLSIIGLYIKSQVHVIQPNDSLIVYFLLKSLTDLSIREPMTIQQSSCNYVCSLM